MVENRKILKYRLEWNPVIRNDFIFLTDPPVTICLGQTCIPDNYGSGDGGKKASKLTFSGLPFSVGGCVSGDSDGPPILHIIDSRKVS